MKRCCKCKKEKPETEFYRASSTSDGLQRCCKNCGREYSQKPETIEKKRLARKRWYEKNRDHELAVNRRWREANYHRIAARASAQAAAWNKANPEKRREIVTRRRLAARGISAEKIDRAAIFARDGYCCHICGKHVPRSERTLDHLVPLSKGGTHRADNVRLAHHRCNSARGAGRLPAQLLLVG